jgi:hypothetical protein
MTCIQLAQFLQSRASFGLLLALSLAALPSAASAEHRLPQGGGVIYPSWTAQYWANPTLDGTPAWEKKENRINFDWEDWRPVLGLAAESVRDFPTDNFSVRFSGTLIARFSEEYTFKLESDEGARLKIRPQGSATWTTLIDAWAPHKRRVDTACMALKQNEKYDVELEYYELTGDAVCALRWESRNTADEVIDYAAANTMKDQWPYMLADAAAFDMRVPLDDNGWPSGDGQWALTGGYSFYPGRFLIRFNGQADVGWNGASFIADGETFSNAVPKGKGYDPKTNRTTLLADLPDRGDGCAGGSFSLKNSQRTPQSPAGSGVTDICIMKPKKVGGIETQEPGEVVCDPAKEAFLPVYAWRVQRTGLNEVVDWKDRTRPTYSQYIAQHSRAEICYEKLAIAANEMGRDLHLCFGGSINYEFMDKLAKLFMYGSDGENPYDKPTKNPKWPPLNPNLRLYLEHGNEMGWSAIQPRDWSKDYERIRKAKQEPEWSVLNFDGLAEANSFAGLMRYHAYRTVRMSEAMRKVWGDAAMGEKVRVMIFGAYLRSFQNDFQQFVDDYYNNGAGTFVEHPHPPSYYFWGTGGAIYYSTSNPWAVGKTPGLENNSFEGYSVAAGSALVAPTNGGGWSFEGTAGVVDVRLPRHLAFAATNSPSMMKLDKQMAVGFKFTVGPKPIFVYEVGRWVQAGETGKRAVGIYAADGTELAPMRAPVLELKGAADGQALFAPLEYSLWATTDSARVGLWRLEAGKSYIVVSTEPAGDVPAPVALRAGPDIMIDGPVQVAGKLGGEKGKPSCAVDIDSQSGKGFPLATFRYTDQALEPAPGLSLTPPDPSVDPNYAKGGRGASLIPESHRTGSKMAFIAGKGGISQTFMIRDAGDYAFVFSGVCGVNDQDYRSATRSDNPLTIKIDGQTVWSQQIPSGSRKSKFSLFQYGTSYIHLDPGEHKVSIEGTRDDPAAVSYIDAAHIGSMLDMAGGPTAPNFLGAGTATGGTDDPFDVAARGMAEMARIWGLAPYCYEGGTNPGGDWNGGGVLYAFQFKEHHPLSKVADSQWARLWHQAGGANAMFYYEGFPAKYIHRAGTYVQWQAAIERAHAWQLEPTDGIKLPAVLTCTMSHFQGQSASDWKTFVAPWQKYQKPNPRGPELVKQQWKAWIVNAPEGREYTVTLNTTPGGTARLSVNDADLLAAGESGRPLSGKIRLDKGVHSIKVKCEEGGFSITDITVE